MISFENVKRYICVLWSNSLGWIMQNCEIASCIHMKRSLRRISTHSDFSHLGFLKTDCVKTS